MWRKIILFFIITIILFPIVDSQAEESKKVLVVVIPGLSVDEVEWLIHNETNTKLWQEAAFGTMNIRPDGPYSYLNNMVTFGAGAKAIGVQGWNAFELDEEVNGFTASEWVYQLTGELPSQGLIHPDYHRLMEKNTETTHKGQVGILGELLQQSGVSVEVYGHSDTVSEKIRYGSLLALNQNGTVDGELNAAVRVKSGSPHGVEMDVDYLINKLSTDVETSDKFIVIEWGDLHRLYDQQPYMETTHFNNELKKQLLRINSFIEQARNEVDQTWVIAPMMNKSAYDEKKQLAPLLYWGDHQGGFLTSNTTKQDYLVTSLDFNPTMLAAFEIESNHFSGNVIQHYQNEITDKTPVLKRFEEIVLIYKSRASVLSTYITCLVLALIGAALYGFFGMKKRNTWRYVTRVILLSALWSPFWFLALAGFVDKLGVTGFVLTLIGSSFSSGYVIEKFTSFPIFWIGAFTFTLITVDILLGTPFMQRSYLGYDPIIGARYYGIGNEFAGVYIISAFMILSPILNQAKKKWTIASTIMMLLFMIVLLGKSTLGTNAGATLSAGLAFAFLLYRLIVRKSSIRLLAVLFVGTVGTLFLLLYVLQLTGEQTHIGLAFERLLSGDILYILDTIQRKLQMNLKIFRHSNWTQLFITSYLLGAVILWRKRLQLGDQEKQLFLQVGVVSSFALLVLNDSGVVAAATSMFCVVSAHYYWLSANKEENDFAIGKTVHSSQAIED
ncbi:hypothetical protein [Halalkalibacter akibai]|uniref:Phosphoglyceromutase n=1 Tax=Halalkalibacter akibai (strain ATCC 43226 / DSM 21942 / CIP 109018 / JCM 9157 / 1139) TaxID=1236973 RepID=W4QYW0_HALA3|nr:hypothetical protein [Halalkalibacter akibai]GAE37266.1 phosphoglyceromutase [Halalkalibacter akibai JCM 9157]